MYDLTEDSEDPAGKYGCLADENKKTEEGKRITRTRFWMMALEPTPNRLGVKQTNIPKRYPILLQYIIA